MNVLRLLVGEDHNFYRLLTDQANVVRDGIHIFISWPESEQGYTAKVFAAEERADQNRLLVSKSLAQAFSTPFDREDIEDFSHRLDSIMDSARRAAGEIEALEYHPEQCLREMFEVLGQSMDKIAEATAALEHDRHRAEQLAMSAKRVETDIQQCYVQAMKKLFELEDCREILKSREVYRRVQDIALRLADVAEFLRHLVVKLV